MPRVKLIFQGFGIANCWYPIDSGLETVDNVTTDLLKRFPLKDIALEMDGHKFLGDGLTRLLFKDNDEITVRPIKRSYALCLGEDGGHDDVQKKIKESSLSVPLTDDVVDLIDSADEYESTVWSGEESDAAVLKEQDDVSFHLSVDATAVIQDQDSSDASSVSLVDAEMDKFVDAEMEMQDQVIHFEPIEMPEPGEVDDDTLVEKQVSVDLKEKSRELNLVKDVEREIYDGRTAKDMTIKKTIDDHDKGIYKCFYELANVLKDKNGKWVADQAILCQLNYTFGVRFWTKYGYDTWKGYLKAGEQMNLLKLDFDKPTNKLFLTMTKKMCCDILSFVDSEASKPAINVIDKCVEPVITVSNNEISDVGTAIVQPKTVQPIIPALPCFPVTNCYQQNNTNVPQKLIPALPGAGDKPTEGQRNVILLPPPAKPAIPAPQEIHSHGKDNEQIVEFVPFKFAEPLPIKSYQSINYNSNSALTNLLPENLDKKTETWGINDSFFGKNKKHSNSLIKDASEGSSDKNDKSIQPQEDFSKSKNLTEQYKCFIDLAKYCEDFRPEEWIPGNGFIKKFPGFYLKYGQSRWKTYLEWGKKLKLLDFRLINNELHVKMSKLMQRMIISLFNSHS